MFAVLWAFKRPKCTDESDVTDLILQRQITDFIIMHGVLLVIQLVKSIIEGVTEKRTESLKNLTDNLPSDLALAAKYKF